MKRAYLSTTRSLWNIKSNYVTIRSKLNLFMILCTNEIYLVRTRLYFKQKNILMELTKNLVIIVISLWTRCFIGKKIQENTLTDMSPLSSGWMPPFMILIKWQNNTICSHIVDDIYYIAPLHIFRKVRREAANYHTCFLINYGRLVN